MNTCEDWDNFDDYKIDVILFAANNNCLVQLENFAKSRFHELNDNYRRNIAKLPANLKREYEKIVADSDSITAHNFTLPETINVPHDNDGKIYSDYLFVGLEIFNVRRGRCVFLTEQKIMHCMQCSPIF